MSWSSGYDKLTTSGLPYDWATVFIAKQTGKISDQEVTKFALDLICSDSEGKDNIAALLANTNPQDWQTISRYLLELVSGQIIDRQRCLRLWRYAELKHLLSSASARDKECTAGEWSRLGYALIDLWQEYAELPDSNKMTPDWGETSEDMLHQHNEWLKQEAKSLMVGR